MLIVYDSLTGNVHRFAEKLKDVYKVKRITPSLIVSEPYVLLTYTIGFGEVPEPVQDFLDWNSENLAGVAVSGNRLWGVNFGRAGDTISREFNVPLIHKFELGGTSEDLKIFKEGMDNI